MKVNSPICFAALLNVLNIVLQNLPWIPSMSFQPASRSHINNKEIPTLLRCAVCSLVYTYQCFIITFYLHHGIWISTLKYHYLLDYMSHYSHCPDNLKFYSCLFSPYQSYITWHDNKKMLNTSVTLRIPSILETLPKAELPASVKLHMCTDKTKPDSHLESRTSPAYHFGTDMFAQVILEE